MDPQPLDPFLLALEAHLKTFVEAEGKTLFFVPSAQYLTRTDISTGLYMSFDGLREDPAGSNRAMQAIWQIYLIHVHTAPAEIPTRSLADAIGPHVGFVQRLFRHVEQNGGVLYDSENCPVSSGLLVKERVETPRPVTPTDGTLLASWVRLVYTTPRFHAETGDRLNQI